MKPNFSDTLAGRETRLIPGTAEAGRNCGEKQTAPTTTTPEAPTHRGAPASPARTRLSAEEVLKQVEQAIGARAFADERDRWERNLRYDQPALERALAALEKRKASTVTKPVRNWAFWLESVYRVEQGKGKAVTS